MSLATIASNFIETNDVIVNVIMDGKKFLKLTKITKCKVRQVDDPSANRATRTKKLWENHLDTSYYYFEGLGGSFIELCVQKYLDNGKLSGKMHTTYQMLKFLWKNLENVEVLFDVNGLKYEAKEDTLRELSNASRDIFISEEMVVKEPLNTKRRRVSPQKKSPNLVINHIESFLYGDNYLTIVEKNGKPVVRIYPAWREEIIKQIKPGQTRKTTEYKVRISQYSDSERTWSPKSPPYNASVLEHLQCIGEKGRWRTVNDRAVFFSNFFDVKLGDWLIPVSATAVTSDNNNGNFAERNAFRNKLFQRTNDMCTILFSKLLYPETRIVRCSDLVLREEYTAFKK